MGICMPIINRHCANWSHRIDWLFFKYQVGLLRIHVNRPYYIIVIQVLSNSWDGRPFGHNRHGPKTGGRAADPLLGGAGYHLTVLPGPRPTSLPSGIFIHPTVWPQQTWPKIGGYYVTRPGNLWFLHTVPPFCGGAGSSSNTVWPGPRPTSIQVASWSIQPFGRNRHRRKIGGCSPWEEPGPHLTQCGRRYNV